MKRQSPWLVAAAAATAALLSSWSAQSADKTAMSMDATNAPMGGMNMKMTLPPMPAVYAGQADKPGAPVFTGLSDHHHAISTKVEETQKFFDQGIRLLFAFNHAESIRSFREAARLDPDCAMCWWGVAFALGPNYNLPMQPDAVAPALAAVERARSLEPRASAEERVWIEALATRYSNDPKADRAKLDEAFAQAMGKLWRDYPNDLDAGVFYAEAMMDTQPWDLWQPDGVTPKGHATEIVSTLEAVMKREPAHPGALHLYIHAVEATTTPERAEKAADVLEPLMPQSGHIVHMPSHIYYRVGRYEDAVKVNELAAKQDENYIAACKAQGFYPLAYYSHNIHFLWTSSEMMGREAAARDAARRVMAAAAAGVPMAEQLPPIQRYLFVPLLTDIRFGHWDEALAEPRPAANLKIDMEMSLYARGFAFADKHKLAEARKDRALLQAMIDHHEFARVEAMVPGAEMAAIGVALLDGEIARISGDLKGAVTSFEKAAMLQHNIPYTEPPYWDQPVSHILGAALLQAHRAAEAEAVYRESLKDYRIDGWALFGLAQALDAQGKKAEVEQVRQEFSSAWRLADVKLTSSRF
jgi:tetratricopeptide (TPR) repeat protein